ncbi:hypothetical protein [Winogradskyella marincola]|uniref:Uncharacterized protein n=1 Tax=Winogradskyella marincola TaxID=3037795 RepID=A0ABT6G172_9FLAO|nr:hypothetical protein [Winogradskyella sp. YYF002]MDG4715791.1 hypothetical protein [Winogradskyella sp. YYF002]
MKPENIKTKVNFHFEGQAKPFASAEDYEVLKRFLWIDEESEYETNISEVDVEGKMYEIVDTRISILKETSDLHLTYGIDLALTGESLPYNFRVSVYLKEKE